MEMKECIHCGKSFHPNSRVKRQRYCRSNECQKARKSAWQRRQLAKDPAYRENQEWSWKRWRTSHKGYMREYRARNPEYTARNRQLQIMRNAKRRKDSTGKLIVNMDALAKGFYSRRGGEFNLIPMGRRMIVNMDALRVKLIPLATIKHGGGQ